MKPKKLHLAKISIDRNKLCMADKWMLHKVVMKIKVVKVIVELNTMLIKPYQLQNGTKRTVNTKNF